LLKLLNDSRPFRDFCTQAELVKEFSDRVRVVKIID